MDQKAFAQALRRVLRQITRLRGGRGGGVVIINVNSTMVINHRAPQEDGGLGHFLTGVESSSLRIAVCAIGIATLLGFVAYELGFLPLKSVVAAPASIVVQPGSSRPAARRDLREAQKGIHSLRSDGESKKTCGPQPQAAVAEVSEARCIDFFGPTDHEGSTRTGLNVRRWSLILRVREGVKRQVE